MAKKPQTEEKAKGLYNKVGNYSGKTLNLSGKQLGAAGRKASAARTVSIGNTKYDASAKKVMGPAGKPLTGKVDLGGGNIGVYSNGVRVRAASGKRSTSGTGGTSGGGTGSTSKPKAPTGMAANALARSNKPTSGSNVRAASSGYTAGSTKSGSTAVRPKGGFPSGGRAGNSFTTNPGKDAWDSNKPYSAAQVANAGLLAASVIPVVGPIARGARAAIAGRAAVSALGKVGLRDIGGKAAGRDLANAISKVKTAPPKPAVAVKPKPTPFAKALKQINGTTKGINKETGSVRSPNSKVPMRPANPTPAQKGSLTRYANKRAAERAAAIKSKGGKKK